MLTIQRRIRSYNFSNRNGNSIKYLVLHYTGNRGDTAKNNVDYFYGGNRNASSHYFVDDNSIWQCVEESNAAWAVGNGKGAYGICRGLTANAIGEFQAKYNLTKDYMFGSECFSKAYTLIKNVICKYGNFTPNQTKVIQHVLGISVDGVFANNTKTAFIKFQKSKKLLADGIIGINTWSKLLGLYYNIYILYSKNKVKTFLTLFLYKLH